MATVTELKSKTTYMGELIARPKMDVAWLQLIACGAGWGLILAILVRVI